MSLLLIPVLLFLFCYSDPAGKLVELLLWARLIIEPDRLPSSSGYVSFDASANCIGLFFYGKREKEKEKTRIAVNHQHLRAIHILICRHSMRKLTWNPFYWTHHRMLPIPFHVYRAIVWHVRLAQYWIAGAQHPSGDRDNPFDWNLKYDYVLYG